MSSVQRWICLVSQSYSIILFVYCFDYEIAVAKSAHPHFLTPTLLLSFDYENAVKRKAAVLRTEWVDSATAAFHCSERFAFQMHPVQSWYLRDPPGQSWFPVGTVFLLGPPRPHHHSSVGKHKQKHIISLETLFKNFVVQYLVFARNNITSSVLAYSEHSTEQNVC